MAPGQLTYNLNPPVGVAGMLADNREACVVISKVAKGLVPVGLLCAPGPDQQIGPPPTTADINSANPGQVIAFPVGALGSIADTAFVGIPIYDSSRPPYDTTNAYQDTDPCPVLRKGAIWVKPDVAVTAFTAVFVWVNPGASDPAAGTFTNSTNGGKAVAFTRGQFLSSSSSAQNLAVLEIW